MGGLHRHKYDDISSLRAVGKFFPSQNLIFVILLIALSCHADEDSVTKFFVRPDQYVDRTGCYESFNLSAHLQKYEFSIITNECRTCMYAPKTCRRVKEKVCLIEFSPGTQFMKTGMKVCADVSDIKVDRCGNRMDFGTYSSIIECLRRPYTKKFCEKTGRSLELKIEAFNFCAFKGLIHITVEPAYYRLEYFCPQDTLIRKKGKIVSYNHAGIPFTPCPVKIKAPGTVRKACIRIIYAVFHRDGPQLIIKSYGVYSAEVWRLSYKWKRTLYKWYCDDFAAGLIVSLVGSRRSTGMLNHSVVFEFKFELESETYDGDPHDDDDDDDDDGMGAEYIALIIIGVLCGAGCCYCCVRCCSTNCCDDDDPNGDGIDGDANQENGTPDSELARRNINEPVVHDTVRGTLTALNSRNDSPRTSRSGSPHHIPMSLTAIPSSDFPQDEDAERYRHLSAPPEEEPLTMPPPSYASLFPNST